MTSTRGVSKASPKLGHWNCGEISILEAISVSSQPLAFGKGVLRGFEGLNGDGTFSSNSTGREKAVGKARSLGITASVSDLGMAETLRPRNCLFMGLAVRKGQLGYICDMVSLADLTWTWS